VHSICKENVLRYIKFTSTENNTSTENVPPDVEFTSKENDASAQNVHDRFKENVQDTCKDYVQ